VFQAPDGRFLALAAVVVLLSIWAFLYIGDSGGKTSEPSSPDQRSAVTAARSFVERDARYRYAADRKAWIRDVRGQWEVHFPAPRSVTHTGGPIITVDKASRQVVWSIQSD
jgi:hypothetical protein